LTGTVKDTISAPVGLVSGSIQQGLQNGLKSCWSLFTGAKPESCTVVQPVASEKAGQPETVESNDTAKQLETLMAFSFKEVQNLYWMGEQLESFRLVIKLNRQTLRDIVEHYQDLASRDSFPQDIKDSCKGDLASFFRRVHRIEKNLEIRLSQIESLMSWLHEGKALVKSSFKPSQERTLLIITLCSSTVYCNTAVYKSVLSSLTTPKLSLRRWSGLPIRPRRKQYPCTL